MYIHNPILSDHPTNAHLSVKPLKNIKLKIMKTVSFLFLFFPTLLFAQGKLEVKQENNSSKNPTQTNPPKMIKVETVDGIKLMENPDYNPINEEDNTIILPNEPIKIEENSSPEIKSELNSTY